MGIGLDSDCGNCEPLRFDDTFEGVGNDDAPESVRLDGVAAKVRLLTPAVSTDPTDWLFGADAAGGFKAIPLSLAGLGGQSPSVNDQACNGNFDIWQLGFGPFTVDGYTADQWRLVNGSGATNSVSASAHTAGVWPRSKFFALWNRTVAGSTPSKYANVIEDVRHYAGQQITVSWTLAASVAMDLVPYVEQNFGSGGSPSAAVTTVASAVTVNAESVVSVTFTVPSIAGKTIGSNGDSSVRIGLQRDAAQPNGIVSMWGFHVDVGGTASAYPYEDPANVLAKCQRHLQVLPLSMFVGGAYTASAVTVAVCLPVTMRKAPTIPAPTLTNAANLIGVGLVTPTGVTNSTITPTHARLLFTGLSALTVGAPAAGGAGDVTLDARI